MQVSAKDSSDARREVSSRTLDRAYESSDLSGYKFKERFLIRAADLTFFFLIKLIGATVRWEVHG